MLAAGLSAVAMAELRQRRERLVRLGSAEYQSRDACLDRCGWVCKLGETPQSIDASYRRRGLTAWRDYQRARFHSALFEQYDRAADRRWVPILSGFPPVNEFADMRSLAAWRWEAVLEMTPLLASVLLIVILRQTLSRPGVQDQDT